MILAHEPERLMETIIFAQGNLTHTARLLRVSKAHVMNLVRKWRLNDWAARVRSANGHPPHGNPYRIRAKKTVTQAQISELLKRWENGWRVVPNA